jgi:anaerobic magnesium-protoporphyrin IX monomethyl ester cyclase
MIILFNPKATRPRNRRFPLSVLALASVLEGREDYAVVDGNVDPHPTETLSELIRKNPVELLGVTVMPGPQMVAAIEPCRTIRQNFPAVPIAWGGYFPSIYSDASLNAGYVDYVVRGQGEDTLLELLGALRGQGKLNEIRGLSFKDGDGQHRHNPERAMKGPQTFPWYPYHRVAAEKYLQPSYFGKRTAVHHASIGCPFQCSFCGIVPAYGSREKMEPPARTEAILRHLSKNYGVDSILFFDMNFFLREDHARELAERLEPLGMRWWCEGRIDIVGGYSDATLEAIRRAGCKMIFFGAESGSDWVLKEMKKQITAEQTISLASRIRRFDIIPEFSFVIGNPKDPERDTRECLRFIRKIKILNPAAEIIIYHYTPVPQREQMYGDINGQIQFPATPEEWATDKWLNFTVRIDPATPWLKPATKKLIDNFELVVASRWPTIQDTQLPRWGRALLKTMGAWRYGLGVYAFPKELMWAQRFIELRKPKLESS